MAQRQPKSRAPAKSSKTATNYWSGEVTSHSNALDLDAGVFTWDDPVKIARSLKRSAEASERRKADPFRSAMSMLTFYINRAGKDLPDARRQVLEQVKDELRKAFGRDERLRAAWAPDDSTSLSMRAGTCAAQFRRWTESIEATSRSNWHAVRVDRCASSCETCSWRRRSSSTRRTISGSTASERCN